MAPSDVESHLRWWLLGEKRVYKIFELSFITEYIVIEKKDENEYIADEELSTTTFYKRNKEDMEKLLGGDVLVYYESWNSYTNYHRLKTGGCECGAWATINPNAHVHWCPRYRF